MKFKKGLNNRCPSTASCILLLLAYYKPTSRVRFLNMQTVGLAQ